MVSSITFGIRYSLGPYTPKTKNVEIPIPTAIMKISPTGFTYWGIFIAMYAITTLGIVMRINIPEIVGNVGLVFPMNAAAPNAKTMDITTRTVAFALLEVETPPSRIPVLKKINPRKNKRPESACNPSMKVCAIPP